MAISATQIATSNTLENFRQQYNNLQTDVNGLESGTLTFSSVSATTLGTSALNILEDGTIVFEGATDDGNETTLTVADPSADRTITLPDASGTVQLTGSSSITVADDGTIGSSSDTDAIAISAAGVVTFSATTANTNATDGAVKIAGGLGVALDASVGDDLRLISDSAVLSFGADSDTTLTHTDGTGLTLNSTNKLTFGDVASFVQQSSDGVLRIDGEATIDLNASTAVTVSNDLKLDSDSAVLSFGSDSEITVTHVADTGLNIKHTATADDKPIILTLQTGETDMQASDVIGAIRFQAPDEGTGTDAILVAAGIQAVSEGNFAADNNATTLEFHTGASEAAAKKMALSSTGVLTLSGSSGAIIIPDAGTIGSASDTNAIAIGADGDVTLTQDLELQHDGAILSFGADDDTTLTHTDGTGLSLNSTNKLTFGDAASFVQQSSDGVLRIDGEATIDLNASTAVSVSNDLKLESDSAVLTFGADSEITVTHVADVGLNIKHTATADDKPIILTLQTGETDMAANDVMGAIRFQAPDEGTGTDAILVAAAIQAVSEGDFSSSANATRLEFHTAASEAAAAKMTLSSGGVLDVDGGVTIDNITIDGTEIDLSSGDLTLDVAGDIILDAGGEEVIFKDGSTNVGHASLDSDNFTLKSLVSDKDVIIQGNDGGTGITALTLDMSAAGAATFNNNVTAFSDERLKSDIKTLKSSLEKVLQMRGVSYTRNDNVEGGEQIGVIAQEVEQLYPQVVLTADDEQRTKSVDYGRLTAVLIEAVKELSEIVNRDILSLKKDMDAICQHPLWQEHQKKGE